jgi:predicted N-acetyltransferase YhbS
VRLRLARHRDLGAIDALLRRERRAAEELDLARLLRADPRYQLVITATALIGSVETVVGFGAIDIGAPSAVPTMLVVDSAATDGLDTLLAEALTGRAEALRRTRAA